MPLTRVKSRVRFQAATKKGRHGGGGEAKCKQINWDLVETTLAKYQVDEEPLFVKRRVRPIDELGSLLHSNLSSGLAAAKAHEAQQMIAVAPPSPACQHIEPLQEKDDDTSADLFKLAPLYIGLNVRQIAANISAARPGNCTQEDGPSASLLATTVIYRPLNNKVLPEIMIKDKEPPALLLTNEKAPTPTNDKLQSIEGLMIVSEDKNDSPTPSLATANVLPAPSNHLEQAPQMSQTKNTLEGKCTVDDDNESVVPRLAEIRIKRISKSSTEPVQSQKRQSTFLQRVVTLFAGRGRNQVTEEQQSKAQTPCRGHQEAAVPSTRSHPPLSRSPRAKVRFGGSTPPKPKPPKNFPVSPPILARRHLYLPIDERLHEGLFLNPAKRNQYAGTYYVASDVFQPVEVQQGFPSAERPKSTSAPMRRLNSNAELLDRNDTLWAKWYAKHPTAEILPFAKANKSKQHRESQENDLTDLQVWNAHAAYYANFREALQSPVTDEDISRQMDDKEHERAARLRYHPGHCFGSHGRCVSVLWWIYHLMCLSHCSDFVFSSE